LAKLPEVSGINEAFFYMRNTGFIAFTFITAFFAWKNELQPVKIYVLAGVLLLSVVYINLLQNDMQSDTLLLACIHLPVLLWMMLGFAFVGNSSQNLEKRLDFLRYSGDLMVVCALIMIAGGIMTGMTIGLFALIGLQIEQFYFSYVVVFGLAALPIVGTYLNDTNPQLVNKVSPVIAKIFSPLVLVMLFAYLIAMIYSGSNPYHDRDFLIVFNVLLIGVMAIIFFSVAENFKQSGNQFGYVILFLLSVLTILVNGIALSAILFRISEWGITPNRLAVLGSNILMLANLLWITVNLYKVLTKQSDITAVGKTIGWFLPVYAAWAALVIFLFPLFFNYS
ncbi:MAG: DUF4153 domain-containing protein, partial [Hymenobacteraceae bacterium]|nr:DUF4153 domain-containing protein [Hymenobacteraceae bacterium]MDX5397956.1 DUF4153 domain-containing protein [Hymenobacteraceae bacterium]MDX5514028.1 DUF4153 domain-containing protein [Hymenobacteraceae bacterium]